MYIIFPLVMSCECRIHETSRKSFSKYIKNTECKKFTRGPQPAHEGGGRALPPWARPLPRGPHGGPPVTIFFYIDSFDGKKIIIHLLGRNSIATRRNLGGTNVGLRQSCSAGDTSLREGEIITIVITNAPLIEKGQSPSTSSPAPSHLQTLVHLLYPILVSKSRIGTCGLLVVLITPCS